MKRMISVVLAVIMVMAMSSSAFAAGTTLKSAKNIALKNAKMTKSQVKRLTAEYDREDNRYEVKFRSRSNGTKYSYEIGKSNGRIYEKSVDYKYKRNSSKKKAGKAAAQKAASKKTGVRLATVKSGHCTYEYDDGEGIYEVKFRDGKYSYEVDVLAPTAKVTEYSWEYRGK